MTLAAADRQALEQIAASPELAALRAERQELHKRLAIARKRANWEAVSNELHDRLDAVQAQIDDLMGAE